MKKLILLAASAISFTLAVKAQCPSKVVYTVSKMEILDSTMQVTGTKEVTATFETTDSTVFIKRSENEGDTMAGIIHKATCKWDEPFKNGITTIISDLNEVNEALKNVTISIEGINGKITILLHAVEYPDKLIKLYVDSYEQKP